MKSEKVHEFMAWVSPAAAGTSFVLFLFIPTMAEMSSGLANLAAHLLLASIPALVSATLLEKQGYVSFDSSNKTLVVFFLLSGSGLLLLILGFSFLVKAIDVKLLSTLGISIGLSILLYSWVNNENS